MSELEANVEPSGTTPPLVIAGRLMLLLLATVATVWAFAFSGERGHTATDSGTPVHVHGAAGHEHHAAKDLEEPAHAGHQHAAAKAPEHSGHQHGAAKVSEEHAHAGHQHTAKTSEEQPHAGHQHTVKTEEHAHAGHQHAANVPAPAASPVFAVEPSAHTQDHKVIGTAQRRVFTVEVRAPAWLGGDGMVTAVLREDQLTGLSPGESGVFFRTTAPTEGIDVRLSAEPPAPWDKSTSRVRFRLEARASGLRPGAVGWVKLAARPRESLVVPSGAVLYSPAGPYVLVVAADGGTLSRRRVEIGSVSRGLATVLAGLQDGEPIVVGSAFSWEAERRMRPQHKAIAGVMQ